MSLVARNSSALESDGHAQVSSSSDSPSEVADVGVDLATSTSAGFSPRFKVMHRNVCLKMCGLLCYSGISSRLVGHILYIPA